MILGVPWAIVLALLTEVAVFRLCRTPLSFWSIAGGTVGANAFSWFVGVLIIRFFPIPMWGTWEDRQFQVHYEVMWVDLAFLIACILSTILEYLIWWPIGRRHAPHLLRATFCANLASYTVLGVIGLVLSHDILYL